MKIIEENSEPCGKFKEVFHCHFQIFHSHSISQRDTFRMSEKLEEKKLFLSLPIPFSLQVYILGRYSTSTIYYTI